VGRESVEGGDEQRVCVAEHLERVDSIAGGANHGAQGRGSAVGIDYPIKLSAVWEDADFFSERQSLLGTQEGSGDGVGWDVEAGDIMLEFGDFDWKWGGRV
jgi:hypothetical protein